MNEEAKELDFEDFRIRQEVLEAIAGMATESVEGVSGLAGGAVAKGRGRRSHTRGVVVTADDERLMAEVHVSLEYGLPVQQVAGAVQTSVSEALYNMTGWPVSKVEVFVDGVVFEAPK